MSKVLHEMFDPLRMKEVTKRFADNLSPGVP